MPYQSPKQAAFIHEKAKEGVPWAKKFVADAHGSHVEHTQAEMDAKHHKEKR